MDPRNLNMVPFDAGVEALMESTDREEALSMGWDLVMGVYSLGP